MDDSALCEFVTGWDWIGPGVYIGAEFDSFFQADVTQEQAFVQLLNDVQDRITSFGELIPLEYLATHVNLKLAGYTQAQPVARFINQLSKLKKLF